MIPKKPQTVLSPERPKNNRLKLFGNQIIKEHVRINAGISKSSNNFNQDLALDLKEESTTTKSFAVSNHTSVKN